MAIVYANIGSNLGNSLEFIQKAIDQIAGIFGFYCISRLVESDPWGFDSANRFYNIGIAFKTELNPEEVLDTLQNIEKSISTVRHRDENGLYKDRELDIDIMAIDNISYKSERLILPHPCLYQRDFFLVPLTELKGDNG